MLTTGKAIGGAELASILRDEIRDEENIARGKGRML